MTWFRRAMAESRAFAKADPLATDIVIHQLPPEIEVVGGTMDGQKVRCSAAGFFNEASEIYALRQQTRYDERNLRCRLNVWSATIF